MRSNQYQNQPFPLDKNPPPAQRQPFFGWMLEPLLLGELCLDGRIVAPLSGTALPGSLDKRIAATLPKKVIPGWAHCRHSIYLCFTWMGLLPRLFLSPQILSASAW